MKLKESGNWSVLSFDNYTEAIQFASDKSLECPEACESGTTHAISFRGTKTYSEAHKLATQGWPEGRARVRQLQAAVSVTSRVLRPEIVFDVTGECGIDVGMALSGIPECVMDWRESETVVQAVNGPIVHIVFNGSCAGGVSTEAIENRGAAVLELIDALEASGKRVEVTYIKANSIGGGISDTKRFLIEIPLKTADFACQPDQLVYALTHVSMNRRIGFSLVRQCGRNGLKSAQLDSFGGILPKKWTYRGADIFLARLDHLNCADFKDATKTRRWVLDALKSQGVEIEDGRS